MENHAILRKGIKFISVRKQNDFQNEKNKVDHVSSESDTEESASESDSEASNQSYDVDNSENLKKNHPQNCSELIFEINLNDISWKTIKPVNNRLPKYKWTPVIVRHI